ncbi:MAG: hypothetical protein SFZ02_12275 [bacterium]|nr:hypothetical protein [bacterium]
MTKFQDDDKYLYAYTELAGQWMLVHMDPLWKFSMVLAGGFNSFADIVTNTAETIKATHNAYIVSIDEFEAELKCRVPDTHKLFKFYVYQGESLVWESTLRSTNMGYLPIIKETAMCNLLSFVNPLHTGVEDYPADSQTLWNLTPGEFYNIAVRGDCFLQVVQVDKGETPNGQ